MRNVSLTTPVTLLVAALAIGCGQNNSLLEKLVPNEEDRFARNYIEMVHAKQYHEAQSLLTAQARTPDSLDELRKLGDFMDKGAPVSTKIVGTWTSIGSNRKRCDLSYEIQLTNEWLLARVAVLRTGDSLSVDEFHLNLLPASLESLNAFTFRGKTTRHYVIFGLMIAVGVTTLAAFFVAIKTKLRRKWLWLLFILTGVAKLSFNWSTGQFSFQPIYVVLFSIGAFRPFYGAWLFHIALPLGAVIFLSRRQKLQLKPSEGQTEPDQNQS